ncbi:MAG: UPF0158 family protein [Planctomycetes bacterium]|nr:UPF0158 family protein [Planctomycetota bacterium]
MPLPVSLRSVVQEMDAFSDEWSSYINRKTGELITISHEEARFVEDGEPEDEPSDLDPETLLKVQEVLESDDWLRLPDKFEIHEWSIMDDFARSREDPHQCESLMRALRGGGAFRRFKDVAAALDVRDEWFRYRGESLEQIAIRFLEIHEIPYSRENATSMQPELEP